MAPVLVLGILLSCRPSSPKHVYFNILVSLLEWIRWKPSPRMRNKRERERVREAPKYSLGSHECIASSPFVAVSIFQKNLIVFEHQSLCYLPSRSTPVLWQVFGCGCFYHAWDRQFPLARLFARPRFPDAPNVYRLSAVVCLLVYCRTSAVLAPRYVQNDASIWLLPQAGWNPFPKAAPGSKRSQGSVAFQRPPQHL